MRWILLILFLLNALLLSWYLYEESRYETRMGHADAVDILPGRQLQLLSELQDESLQAKTVQSRVSEGEEGVYSSGLCVYMGAFKAQESANSLHQRLLALGVSSYIEELKIAGEPDYWVYMQPQASREFALRLLKTMQSQGFDAFVITQGELANGLSLGLFTKNASAEDILVRLNAAGYPAKIKRIERFRSEYWVMIKDGDAQLISAEAWSILADDYQYVEKEHNLCKPVA